MPNKYLSGRVERTSQSDLTDDRYEYLGLEQAEPNLGDPSVIPQTLPVGQQYQVISVLGSPGNRFWIPVGGGLIPGAITVFDEGIIVPTNAGVSSITQVNFVGAAISAKGYVYADGSPGIGVTITVFAPGNNQQLLFNNNNEFGTSSLLTFDNVTGILTAGKALNVGIGGTVITATSLGLVGIGTTNPTQELDVNGDIRLRGTIYDYNNQPGVNQQVLIKNNFGGLEWNNQSSIRAGAGGTYTQIQYHNASGLVDGATGFVYDPNTNRVGIGSTSPRYILDVIGTVNISGLATITNLYVSGIGTFNDIVYVISTEQSTSTSTGALIVSGGVGIVKNLNVGGVAGISSLNVTNHTTSGSLYVSGISTLGVTSTTNLTAQTLNVSGISTLGVTSANNLTAQTLRVSGTSTLGVTTATDLTAQSLVVSGISTLGVTSATNLTSQQLNVSGISTLGVTSTTNLTAQTLRVSGISTLGVTSTTNLTAQTLRVSGTSTLGVTTATDLTAQSLVVSGISTFYGNILPGSNGFYDIGNVLYKFNEVYADTFIGQIIGNADTATVATNVNGGTGNLTALNVSGISTLGVTSATNLTSQSLVVSGNGTITNLTGTGVTYTNGTITTLNSTNGTITNLTGTGVTYTNGTITNLTGIAGTITTLNSTNGTITNLTGTAGTITTLNSTNGTITNLTGTAGTITTLNSTNGTITNLTGTGVTYTNGTITTFNSTTGNITNVRSTTINNTGIGTITNLTGTGVTYTNGTITTLNSTTGTITNLTGTAVTYTNGTFTNLSAGSVNYTNSSTTNLYATNGYINVGIVTTISGTNLNYTNGTITNLTGTAGTITTLNSTNGTITNLTGTAVTYTNGTITNLTGTGVTYTNGTITNLTGTGVTYTNGTITTLNSTNGTITNLTGTAGTITTFNSTTGIITNVRSTTINNTGIGTIATLNSTNGTITNLTGTGVTYTNGTITTLNSTNGTITNVRSTTINNTGIGTITTLNSTNGTITNLTGTAGTITTLNSTNGTITNLTGTGVTYTNGTFTNLSAGSISYTNSNATNLYATNGYITVGIVTTISGTNLNYTNGTITNLTGTAGTITTLNSTNGTITNLTGTGVTYTNGTITNLNSTNLNITGISTFQGNVTLGDANTDKVSFGATVDSNIIPSGSRNLGSVANPWSNVYATTITGTIAGNAATATKLLNARTIAITGDLAYTSPAFDGTGNVTGISTLANTGVTSTTYGSSTQVPVFAVDAKGRITSVTNTGVNFTTATVLRAAGLTTARTIAITGDLAYTSPAFDGTGNVTAAGTLATVNSNVGTFGSSTFVPQITVNAKGLVTGITTTGVNFTTATVAQADKLTNARTIAITGDLAYTSPAFDGTGNVTAAGTLATVNSTTGTFGSSTFVPQITVNAKGLVTGISSVGVNFTTATVAQADKLTNSRTIAITGDLAYTSPAFDGTGNVTATGTLAATTVVAGSYGSGSQVATFTVDAKGRLTAASNTSITGINASSVAAAGADTQVQFNDGGAFAGDADFTFAKTTNTVTTRFLSLNGNGSTTSAQLAFNGGTNNWITFGTTGVAAPAFTTRSVGTKIVLYDGIGASSADYGFGIESSTLWSSVPTTSNQFKWYGGTTLAATLTGAGAFTAVGAISGTQLNGTLQYALTLNTSGTGLSGSTTYNNSGAATFTVTSNATSANTASAIVARDGSGDFSARYINSSYFNSTDDISTGTLTHLMGKFGDNYHRSATAAKVATFISGQTMNINGSSTSCSGNAATATNVAYSGLTGTVPTWNQNTTGNAATATVLQTARTINGVSFNGSANITISASEFASGTTIVFYQASAPTGWTKSTSHNNKALRVVSGSGGGSGGSTAFTSVFASRGVPLPEHNHSASSNTHAGHQHSGPTNNQNANHTHTFTTGNQSADHTHTFTTNSVGDHQHIMNLYSSGDEAGGYGMDLAGGFENRVKVSVNDGDNTVGAGGHDHGGTTAGMSANHQHGGTTAGISTNHYHDFQTQTGGSHNHSISVSNNGTASASMDFAVQYIDVIICSKN